MYVNFFTLKMEEFSVTADEFPFLLWNPDGMCFWQKTHSKLPVALLVDKDEKAKRMEGKLVESLHKFRLDKELVWQEIFWCENGY